MKNLINNLKVKKGKNKMRHISFKTTENEINIEEPFVIGIMYKILEDELNESESLIFKSEIEFEKIDLDSIRRVIVNIMASLEQIIRMLGGDVGLRHCLEEYMCYEDTITEYLINVLVIFYGSDKKELRNNCLRLYFIFNDLNGDLIKMGVDGTETCEFINNTCIIDYYK